MSENSEIIKWYLTELSCQDGDDIESNEIEIMGEDENGNEGFFSVNITDIAEKALEYTAKLEKVTEAAKAHINFDLHEYIHDKEVGNLVNRHPATVALLEALMELGESK